MVRLGYLFLHHFATNGNLSILHQDLSPKTTTMLTGKKLSDEPLHLGLDATAYSLSKITGMEWYEKYSKDTEADGNEGRLVSTHTFSESWDMWEMHPEGEEVVICTKGVITLHQDDGKNAGLQTIVLREGEYAVNPKGVWHTADCNATCSAIFITPGRGTQHKPRDGE